MSTAQMLVKYVVPQRYRRNTYTPIRDPEEAWAYGVAYQLLLSNGQDFIKWFIDHLRKEGWTDRVQLAGEFSLSAFLEKVTYRGHQYMSSQYDASRQVIQLLLPPSNIV